MPPLLRHRLREGGANVWKRLCISSLPFSAEPGPNAWLALLPPVLRGPLADREAGQHFDYPARICAIAHHKE